MVDDQWNEIKEINEAFMKGVIQRQLENAFTKEELEMLIERKEESLRSTLLPFQLDRLNQIAAQVRIRWKGYATALTTSPISDQLKITANQKKRIEDRETKIRAKLAREIDKLKKKAANQAKDATLKELTATQRNAFNTIVGEKFDFEKSQNE